MDNQQPSVKRCKLCGQTKPVSEFYRRGGYDSGIPKYDASCKECRRPIERDLANKRYKANPERYRSFVKKYRDKDRDAARERDRASHKRKKMKVLYAYGGPFCACCGESHFSMLTIDHINNDGAAHRAEIGKGKKNVGSRLYQWLITNKYPTGFQVLCFNCNSSKHVNGGVCEHQLDEGSTTSRKA